VNSNPSIRRRSRKTSGDSRNSYGMSSAPTTPSANWGPSPDGSRSKKSYGACASTRMNRKSTSVGRRTSGGATSSSSSRRRKGRRGSWLPPREPRPPRWGRG